MLVLSRRKNQSVVIGDDVVITVLDVRGDQIRLGITAPRDVRVHRVELLEHDAAVAATAPRAATGPDDAAPASRPSTAAPRVVA